ncbi:MAG TPA: lipocalin-like domain-containing protein [Candidatus Sulfotelmatobacter sp.]|nr:lipocalin-like domain-containing protein [Candidatus Sulfotelmatobacter sp.]
MIRSLALRLGILFVAATLMAQSGAENRASTGGIRDRFVGAWRLAWLEEPDANGKVHKADCTGLLVYTRDGHMSVQVQYRMPKADDKAAPVQYAAGGYEASFGTYKVDDANTFTFHVEGALVRALIGKDLKRVYQFSGKQLIVKSPDPKEHWRVAWERY